MNEYQTNMIIEETVDEKAKRKKKFKMPHPVFIVFGIIFLIHGLTLILPFIWMFLTSFKGYLEYEDNFLGFPQVWHWENYTQIYDVLQIPAGAGYYPYTILDMFKNSLILAVVVSFFDLLPKVLCSYVAARYKFFGSRALFYINLFVMTIPIQGSLANTLTIYRQLHIYNNPLLYMILPGGAFGFNWLLLYGIFKGIPQSYSEAVYLDGGGHFTVFFRIVLPMVVPTLTALYILSFIGSWNNYSSTLLFIKNFPTLAYGLWWFQEEAGKYGYSLPQIMAAMMLCSIPSVVLFCSFQKGITRSLMVGGLKE